MGLVGVAGTLPKLRLHESMHPGDLKLKYADPPV
jgi:hypothetical protein